MNYFDQTASNRLGGWSRLALLVVVICSATCVACAQGQTGITNEAARLYFTVENLDTEEVTLRGTTTAAGFSPNSVILAPETRYRIWLLRGSDGHIGFQEIKTGQAGQRFDIPRIVLGFPISSDSDGDGLSDDAEFVLGTSATNPDSNGDGIPDGAALKLGIDPGLLSQTRVVGTADTDGDAVDVCAVNDIAIVADSAAGVTVFNVFNRMAPIRIAQVSTPGPATAITCSGNLIAAAVGSAGLAIIDITDPPAARVVRQVRASEFGGGNVRCVAALGDLVFVGTDAGLVSLVEMGTGVPLDEIKLGGRIEDLAIEGSTLYVFGSEMLSIIPVLQGPMQVVGSVSIGGPAPPNRGRIFVGGGVAFLTYLTGYVAYDVQNPAAPSLLVDGRGQFINWTQVIWDGSRSLLNPSGGRQLTGLDRLLLKDPASAAVFETTIEAPGEPRSVALYNGIGYLASGQNGLHVINYREIDTQRVSPVGTLSTLPGGATVMEGQRIVLRAAVTDDVQVQSVQFFVNGSRYQLDGNFPFETGWRAPARSAGSVVSISAMARDTGGNETNLNTIRLTVLPDTKAPLLVVDSPRVDDRMIAGDDIEIVTRADDDVGVNFGSYEFLIDGQRVEPTRLSATRWRIRAPEDLGPHTLSVRAADYAGNIGEAAPQRFFVIREAISTELTVSAVGRRPGSLETISREITVMAHARAPGAQEAISRELTVVAHAGSSGALEAISRELTVVAHERAPGAQEAISRELTLRVNSLNATGNGPSRPVPSIRRGNE